MAASGNPLRDVVNLEARELEALRADLAALGAKGVAAAARLDRATIYRAVSGEPVHTLTAATLRIYLGSRRPAP